MHSPPLLIRRWQSPLPNLVLFILPTIPFTSRGTIRHIDLRRPLDIPRKRQDPLIAVRFVLECRVWSSESVMVVVAFLVVGFRVEIAHAVAVVVIVGLVRVLTLATALGIFAGYPGE